MVLPGQVRLCDDDLSVIDSFTSQQTTLPLKIGDVGGTHGAGLGLVCCARLLCGWLRQSATIVGTVAPLSAAVAYALASPSSAALSSCGCKEFSGESLFTSALFLSWLTKLFNKAVSSCLRRSAVRYAKVMLCLRASRTEGIAPQRLHNPSLGCFSFLSFVWWAASFGAGRVVVPSKWPLR